MSMILFYSNFCENSSKILPLLAQSELQKDIHFICIDNRFKKVDGSIYVILPNQKEILLPTSITMVPALLLLNRGNQVIFGNKIKEYLNPVKNTLSEKLKNVDPEAFSFQGINSSGVCSDNFSFLDQSIESLSAKGNGGLRQLRNNVTLEYTDNIETPPDDYIPNKIGDVSMEKIQNDREKFL